MHDDALIAAINGIWPVNKLVFFRVRFAATIHSFCGVSAIILLLMSIPKRPNEVKRAFSSMSMENMPFLL